MPILKQLVLSSSQAKRRSRVDLTAEMISAPLGDFRHTMHVGRGGDAFGDTSFLEPPQDVEQRSSPKQSLLARTFRSSKRSHSSSHTDKPENSKPPGESPSYVKNAISLPYLNDEDASRARGAGFSLPKSVSSSPAKNFSEANRKPANGPIPPAVRDLELIERDFGELTDLPVSSVPPCGGMKHAESVLSFHIDLGPSMLGDILSVMDRKGDTGLRCEEELDSPKLPLFREPVEEGVPPVHPPRLRHAPTCPYTSELLSPMAQQHPDRRSTEDQPHNRLHHRARDDTRYTPPTTRDDRDISYMDEEDDEDEIRV